MSSDSKGFPLPPLAVDDVLPSLRADLRVERKEDHGQLKYEVSDPQRDVSFEMHDFELSLARMLNGQRTVGDVISAAEQIGLPVTPESLQKFVRRLQKHSLIEAKAALGPASPAEASGPPGSTWQARAAWTPEGRTLYQAALKAFRADQLQEAKQCLTQLLDQQPATAEATELLARVDALLTQYPEGKPELSFATLFSQAEAKWFEEGETGQFAPDEDEQASSRPANPKKKLIVAGVGLVALGAVLAVPLPYSASAPGVLAPRASVEVKMPRAAKLAELLVKDGQWVEAGQKLARFDVGEAQKKLAELDARIARLEREVKKAAKGSAKVNPKMKAKVGRLEADLAKATAAKNKLAKAKKTSALKKAEKKVAALAVALKKAKAQLGPDGAAASEELAAKKAAREPLAKELASTELLAPAAGEVASPTSKVGERLNEGDLLLRIDDTKSLKVLVKLDAKDATHVHTGSELTFTSPALPAKSFDATVAVVKPSEKGAAVAEAVLEKPDPKLRPGMTGEVSIAAGSRSLLLR
ncbi:MAG: efflux RND transporter periplasmic adaptor subunit [Myxococcota bacterium]